MFVVVMSNALPKCYTSLAIATNWILRNGKKAQNKFMFFIYTKKFLSHPLLSKRWDQTLPWWQKGQKVECDFATNKIWFFVKFFRYFFWVWPFHLALVSTFGVHHFNFDPLPKLNYYSNPFNEHYWRCSNKRDVKILHYLCM